MIELADYWMGRDRTHGLLMSVDLQHNAARTIELANKLLILAKTAGVHLHDNPNTGSIVSSGWRPPDINARTAGAAKASKHLTGEAIDLYDPQGELGRWLLTADGQRAMIDLGLWQEDPSATKTWAHVQTRPPGSGRRTFMP